MAQRSNDGPGKYVALTGSDQQAVTGAAILLGVSVSGGASAPKLNLHDGDENTDPLVASITVGANGSGTVWLGPGGVACPNGIYVDVVTGNATGAVLYR
jgi:hypothetical protein